MKNEKTDDRCLLEAARNARKSAYTPYSGFSVGAALLTDDGRIYTGCNIENAAFGPTVCAERVAIFKAVSEGVRGFTAIAVVGGKTGETGGRACPPCGVCRQVMAEFCEPGRFRILLEDGERIRSFLLSELLPEGFFPATVKG